MNAYHTAILLVEDDPTDRTMIERSLKAAGTTEPICAVNNGEEAIAFLTGVGQYADRTRFPYPSLIITDLKMPKVDGFGVLKHLQSHAERAVVPTLVLTASSDPDDIRKAYELGANGYHIKPTHLQALRSLIKLIRDYWLACEIPEVDASGYRVTTNSKGKLGEAIPTAHSGGVRRNGDEA